MKKFLTSILLLSLVALSISPFAVQAAIPGFLLNDVPPGSSVKTIPAGSSADAGCTIYGGYEDGSVEYCSSSGTSGGLTPRLFSAQSTSIPIPTPKPADTSANTSTITASGSCTPGGANEGGCGLNHICAPGSQTDAQGNTIGSCIALDSNGNPISSGAGDTTINAPGGGSFVDTNGNSFTDIPAGCLIVAGAAGTGKDASGRTTIDCTGDPLAPSGNGADTGSGQAGQTVDPGASGVAGQTVAGPTTGCGSGSTGGSLGNAGSQLLGSLVNQLGIHGAGGQALQSLLRTGTINNTTGIISQLTGNSTAGKAINLILGSTGLGNKLNTLVSGGIKNLLGNSIGNLTNGLTGVINNVTGSINGALSSIGNSISGFFGGSVAGNAFGASGVAGQVVSSVTDSVGGAATGAVGSLASGALGSVAGIAGGLLAGPVPVSDSSLQNIAGKIQGNTNTIQSDQDMQLQVTCVNNVLVKQARQQFTAQMDQAALDYANTGRNGGPIYYTGPAQDAQRHDALANYYVKTVAPNFVNGDILSQVQKTVAGAYTSESDLAQQLKCDVPQAEKCRENSDNCPGTTQMEKVDAMLNMMANESQCTPSGAAYVLTNALKNRTQASDAEVAAQLAQGQGYYGNVKCDDPSMDQQTCQALGTYTIVNPGINQSAETIYHLQSGETQQANATEIGGLVDPRLAQLGIKAFTSILGVLGLSQNQNGQGSYLNQVTGNTNTSTVASAKAALQSDIETSLGTEVTYEGIVNDELTDLGGAQTVFASTTDCFGRPSAPMLGTVTPQAVYADASTTLNGVIVPQIADRAATAAASEAVISQLTAYDTQVQQAQNINDVNTLWSAYQALIDSGALHTSADVTLAAADRDASQASLAGLVSNANASLAVCQGQ